MRGLLYNPLIKNEPLKHPIINLKKQTFKDRAGYDKPAEI